MHRYLQLFVDRPIIINNVHEYTNEIIHLKIRLTGHYSIKSLATNSRYVRPFNPVMVKTERSKEHSDSIL
jgi:hypothetical protein